MKHKMLSILFASLMCMTNCAQAARIPIVFWHAMSGSANMEVRHLAEMFNQSQQQYQVFPVYKGTYAETLTSTVAAFRVGQQPDLVQILEVGSATMLFPKGAIEPVYHVMAIAGLDFKPNLFIPSIGTYYSDNKGRLLAMPFNSSAAVLYFNKDAFARAGLDSKHPPATYPELYAASVKLRKAGFACGFTTTWPSWIQIETFSAWHNLSMASENNGFDGLSARLQFAEHPLLVKHISTLAEWQKQHIFQYGGRDDDAQALFTSGQCAMMFQSSGALASLRTMVPFKLGVAALPSWPSENQQSQNALIGGGALWVMSGKSDETYRGIAAFIQFLLRPEIQVEWQTSTGYLPITIEAYALARHQHYYQHHPAAQVAIEELLQHDPTSNSRGLRLGHYTKIREIITEALEAIWSGSMTVQDALKWAEDNGNLVLSRFQSSVQEEKS